MSFSLSSVIVLLSILWFFVYWILGGVFFALVAILRLGRVRKVRFSCLFSLWTLAVAIGAAHFGTQYSGDAVEACALDAQTRSEQVVAIFGCGFGGVLGAFLIGAAVLVLGGFIIMAISKSKSKPWIVLKQEEQEEKHKDGESQSKYF